MLDDDQLSSIGRLAQRADDSRHESDDPVVEPLIDTLIQQLSAHPEFAGHVRTTFIATVRQAVLFLRARLDLTSSSLLGPKADDGGPTFDYRRRPRQDQRLALESDLQRDFHGWLLAGPLYNCVSAEPTDLALGRGDLILRFGSTRYLAEIKKEDGDASREHIDSTYLVQATEYGNTNVPFGLLLVLDLTDKTSSQGTRRLDELVWVASHTPTGSTTDRLVVAGVLPGNRISPSAYSR